MSTLLLGVSLTLGQTSGTTSAKKASAAPTLTYNQLIGSGYDLLKQARIGEAYLAAMEAARKDPSRFEAYALAALALHVKGADPEAKTFIDKALSRAPADKKPLLNDLAGQIARGMTAASMSATGDPTMRRKLDVLRLIVEDADKSAVAETRYKFLQEFLDKSGPFVMEYPDNNQIWVLRGSAAVELDAPQAGREAAFQLLRLGQDKSDNERIRRLIATMDRKGWIYEMTLQVQPQVTAFNRVLRDMEAVTCEAGAISSQVSYGELRGTCASGFDLQEKWNTTQARTRTYTTSRIYRFDVANSKFYSVIAKDHDPCLPFVGAGPASVHDYVHTESGVSQSVIPDPNRVEVRLPAKDDSTAVKLSDLLNKLHWACFVQSKAVQEKIDKVLDFPAVKKQ